jgi:hypothetical protein
LKTNQGEQHALISAHCIRAPAFAAAMTFESNDANAVVCARGVVRAGCAGPNGAVVVRRPVAACRMVLMNGVMVRRCI